MAEWGLDQITSTLWLDAADSSTLTTDTGISEWRSKSGDGNRGSQATGSLQPTLTTVSGLGAALYLSGGKRFTLNTSIPITTNQHCFALINRPTAGTHMIPIGRDASGSYPLYWFTDNRLYVEFGQASLKSVNLGSITGTYLLSGHKVSSALTAYVNGTAQTLTSSTATPSGDYTQIGARRISSSEFTTGYIALIFLVSGALSDDDRHRIEARILWDRGLQSLLPSDHPYRYASPKLDTSVIRSVLDQAWGNPDVVAAATDQSWGIKFGADLVQPWSDAPVVKGLLSQPWGNVLPIRSQLVQRWQDMVAIRTQLNQPWAIMESLLASLQQPWAITSGPVQTLLDQGWSIRDIEPIMAMLHQPWAIAADGSVLRYQVEVLADGQTVRTSQVNIEGGLDGDVLTCEIHPETEAEYLLCPFGAHLVVTVTSQEGTDTFSFTVIEPRITEEHGKAEYVVVAMSPAVLLGEPYADGLEGDLSGLASEIASTLAAPIPLSWETVDWTIPAGVWIASGETPLALLKTLAAAVGAVVQGDPDGTLAIRPKYRIPLPNLDQEAVGLQLTEILDCFSTGDTPDHRAGYNRFMVGNQSASSDTGLTLEQTEVSAKVKEVRGYQVPWTGDFELTHTGGPWVIIEPMGIEEREETETIEFVSGAGRTKFPIYDLLAMEWQRVNLGTVTTAEDGGLAADTAGQSLLTITYTTKCKLWRVHDLKSEQLQLVAEL